MSIDRFLKVFYRRSLYSYKRITFLRQFVYRDSFERPHDEIGPTFLMVRLHMLKQGSVSTIQNKCQVLPSFPSFFAFLMFREKSHACYRCPIWTKIYLCGSRGQALSGLVGSSLSSKWKVTVTDEPTMPKLVMARKYLA